LFPELTKQLKITRQVIFFFAPPPGADDLMENKLPTWFNKQTNGVINLYGIPGHEHRGFKAATELTDVITDKFDTYNRFYKSEELEYVQLEMGARFPKMSGRPLIESRVCQYTETPDKDFILDKHPEAANLWLMGGGSGHGYKMGASFGELAADTVSGEREVLQTFSLKRLLG
jgi:glycine/D-amino acid oxidase-like deaminating enzyme